MRSFHHSRGRIFFEVLCAFGISASCVGAWMQTYSTALLGAAAIAALYGLVHFFDMFGRRPAVVEPVVEPRADGEADLPIHREIEVAAPVDQPADNPVAEAVEPIEESPPASVSRRPKAPKKAGSRRVKAPKEVKVAEPVTLDEPPIADFEPPEPEAAASAPAEQAETDAPVPHEEENHAPVVPLFESDPFVRQQRTVFGRKAG